MLFYVENLINNMVPIVIHTCLFVLLSSQTILICNNPNNSQHIKGINHKKKIKKYF